jgi:anaerobic magnesium-protoporphyrin IX monomethyl ester cyclase
MTQRIKALFLVPPLAPGDFATQTDAVLARCAGIFTKTDYVVPPLGLAYCAAAVEEWADAEVGLVDAVAGKNGVDEILDVVAAERPDLLYVAAGTSTLWRDLAFLARAKAASPGTATAVMGTHVSARPDDGFAGPGADFLVRGEPEATCADLARAVRGDVACNDVAGLSWRDGSRVVHNPLRPLIAELDALPHPARRFFRPYHYDPPFMRHGRFDIIITSRGCPYPCNYCSTGAYYGRKIRFRSNEDVLAELREMVEGEGVRQVGFWDDTFTIGKRRVVELCDLIAASGLDFSWMCMSRVDTVDGEVLAALKRGGCYLVIYGVESGSQRVLDRMGKMTTVEQARQAFEATARAGLEAAAFFMFGNLGEREEDMRATVDLAKELPASFASFNVATPYPGTAFYDEVKGELGEDFEGYDARRAVCGDAALLEHYIKKGYREFYLRPAYVWRRFRRLRSPGDLGRAAKAGIDVLGRYVLGRS